MRASIIIAAIATLCVSTVFGLPPRTHETVHLDDSPENTFDNRRWSFSEDADDRERARVNTHNANFEDKKKRDAEEYSEE